jgi:phage-related minor tail protein|nr:MAG TPA: tail tape measure [Caudoviricetes sp.]
MAGSIKGIIVEIGGDTSSLQKALSKVNSATSSLSKELTGINRLLKLDPKSTELLSQKQAVLSENIETTKNKLAQLQDIQEQALQKGIDKNKEQQENWRALQRTIDSTKIKLNKLLLEQDGWNVNGKKIEEFGEKIVKVNSKIDNLGSKFTTRLTLPIVALGTIVTKSAMEQEASIQQVEKIYGEASDTIKEFANNTALSYNMSSKSAYKYSQIFGNLIQSMTDDQSKNAQYTQDLLKASSVIASATGRTMEDVMDRIRSGLLGNTEAIEDLGVNVNVSLLESTEAFRRFAGDKSWNQLDFQTQQQIRLFGILEQTTKKYGDEVNVNTTSKVQKLTSKLENMGSKLSSKLLPIADKWIDRADEGIKKLEKLDDKTLDNIIKIGLFVAAAGPFITIFSKIGTVSGNTIKYLGKFAQKIGELDVKSKTATTTFSKFSNGLGSFAGKASLVALGTGTIIGILTSLDKKINETVQKSLSASDDFINNISMQNQARQNNIDAINETLNANLSEINNVKSLKKELSGLVDENGKVKEGYELRTKFILNELNKALGTEYSQTDNIINNYRNLQDEIDKLILKKKAQIILDANEEKYKDAIKNKTKLYEEFLDTQNAIALKKQEIADIDSKYYLFEGSRLADLKKAEDQYNELNNVLEKQTKQIKEYNYDIQKYEENSKLAMNGTTEDLKKIEQSTVETYRSVTNTQELELSKRIKNETDNLNQKKKIYDIEKQVNKDAKNSIYATNVEESQKNVSLIAEELVSMTSSVNELSPELIAAWTTLATNSRENYNNAIAQMPWDMQDKINEITAFVRNDTSVKDAAKFLGQEAVNQLNISSKFEEAGKNWIKGVSKGINNKLLRQEALSSMHSFGVEGLNAIRQQAWDEHSPSKETEKAAKNLLKGVTKGINKEKSSTISNMLKFGQEFMKKFNGSMSLNFNSLQNIPRLQSSISQTISTQLQPKILQPNIVINTQHLDNNEMNRIIDTVNKKFGMQI